MNRYFSTYFTITIVNRSITWFFVSISNTITNAKYTYDPGTGTGTAETVSNAAITKGSDAVSSTIALKNDEYIKFIGVPSNQTSKLAVVVKEFNNTPDQYTPTVAATNGSPAMVSGQPMAANTGSDSTKSFDVVTNDVASQMLTITNTLEEISPTNVVMRFAPYLFILGAAIVLLVLMRRRKAHNDAE